METISFSIVTDGIEGSFSETYYVGQYVSIQHSAINDGVYKITAISSGKLTLDATLLEEAGNDDIILWGLALPNGLLSVVSNITTYVSNQGTGATLMSESQGNRSVSYKDGSDWKSAYNSQLSPYKAMYDDRDVYCRRYSIDRKV